MSIKYMSWVWENSKEKGSALLLLLALADAANDDGYCWPGMAYLAKKTRLGRRYVIQLIDQLEKDGAITVLHRRDGEVNLSNHYRVLAPSLVVNHSSPPSEPQNTTPSEPENTKVVNPSSPKPSVNRQLEPSKNHSAGKPAKSPDSRSNHPAIQLIRGVTGRMPPKAIYDLAIEKLGNPPDGDKFARVHQTWVARGFNPTNLEGQFTWYIDGIPEYKNGNGKKPIDAPAYHLPDGTPLEFKP